MKKKLHIWSFIVVFICFFCNLSKAQTVDYVPLSIKKIPQNVDEFLVIRDELGQNPNAGAACFLTALLTYSKNPDLGTKLLTMTIDRELLIQGSSYNGFQPKISDLTSIKAILNQKPYFFNTYVAGTFAEQNFQLPPEPLSFDLVRNPPTMYKEAGEVFRVLVKCNADTKPRLLKLRKDYKGSWKVYDWSSILTDLPKKQ
jgi:hypothetical protein